MKKIDFSKSISETSKKINIFISISWLASFGVYVYIQQFFDVVRNKL